jgi:hypothetical protein
MNVAVPLILACFAIAFTLSATGWFERFSAAQLFGMGTFLSSGGFAVLYRISERFRLFLRRGSLKRLTLVQTLRFYGVLALIKTHQHVLPAAFAVPTGLIDIAFASTSFFVAARLVNAQGRISRGFVAWHVAGLGGLAISITLAVLTSSARFGLVDANHTIQPMTRFPMSLVPVFIGPMVLIFHLLALAGAYEQNRLLSREIPRD